MDYKYKKILVAVDGSEMSKKAFDRAVQIAKRDDAELFLAHVIETIHLTETSHHPLIRNYLDINEIILERSKENAIEMLSDYEEIAKKLDFLNIKKLIKFGSPKEVLLEEIIPEEKIELVILGATGLNAIESAVVGNVSENVFRYAKCDVLAIR